MYAVSHCNLHIEIRDLPVEINLDGFIFINHSVLGYPTRFFLYL